MVQRLLRRAALLPYVGGGKTSVFDLIQKDEFPRPINLSDGGRNVAWLEDEVADWQQYRRAKRDGAFSGNYRQWRDTPREAA